MPTLPATATGTAASRWMWPIHSVVVVLPLVPVTAMKSLSSSRQPSSTSPSTGYAPLAGGEHSRGSGGYTGALDERPGPGGEGKA